MWDFSYLCIQIAGHMAKKTTKTEENSEPVTNFDQFKEVVANSSQSEAAKPSGDQFVKMDANV